MLKKKLTHNGTVKSMIIPWNKAIITKSEPEYLLMMGNVVSIVVAPPALMGARLPKYFTIHGASNKTKNSRIMFANKAIVPSSAPRYSVMRMLDKE